jgi:hypothetical protein
MKSDNEKKAAAEIVSQISLKHTFSQIIGKIQKYQPLC